MSHGLNFYDDEQLKYESFVIKALKNYLCEYDEGMSDYFIPPEKQEPCFRRGMSINDNILIA